MKHVIILHGRPSKQDWLRPDFPSTSNYYWLPWVQKQLALAGVSAQTPEVPNAYVPDYSVWKSTFEQFDVNKESILVGHSCGGGFLVRWLSENTQEIKKLVLVAPWVDAAGDPDNEHTKDFMDFTIDKDLANRAKDIVIIASSNDAGTIQRSVEKLRQSISGMRYVELQNRGHFYDDNAMEFPELVKEILK